jgi:hypothetical protein
MRGILVVETFMEGVCKNTPRLSHSYDKTELKQQGGGGSYILATAPQGTPSAAKPHYLPVYFTAYLSS